MSTTAVISENFTTYLPRWARRVGDGNSVTPDHYICTDSTMNSEPHGCSTHCSETGYDSVIFTFLNDICQTIYDIFGYIVNNSSSVVVMRHCRFIPLSLSRECSDSIAPISRPPPPDLDPFFCLLLRFPHGVAPKLQVSKS